MSVSVNGGGNVQKSGVLFRVLIVLAIVLQGGLFAHNHATASVSEAQAVTRQ